MEFRVSVIIPCLNEEASIANAVKAAQAGLAKLHSPGEVVVVDNGSKDRSASLATAAGARVVREDTRGYGAALRKGFAVAKHDILIMADGDMSYDLTRIDEMVAPIRDNTADFVIGNRMNGIHHGAMPKLHQHFGTPFLTWILRMMFGCRTIKDSQCGFRAIRKDSYAKLNCMTTGMEFATEMIIKAIHSNLRIAQRDIEYHCRTGTSKLRPLQDGWRHIRFILLYIPSLAILLPPLLLWVFSTAALSLLLAGPISVRSRQFDLHTMILVAVLNIASMQIMTGGMIARIYAHLNGFRRDALIAWLYSRFHFKSGVIVSAVLLVLGLLGMVGVVAVGSRVVIMRSDTTRVLLFGMCCFVNGLQLWVASYMTSIMALPRHAELMPPEAEKTGMADME